MINQLMFKLINKNKIIGYLIDYKQAGQSLMVKQLRKTLLIRHYQLQNHKFFPHMNRHTMTIHHMNKTIMIYHHLKMVSFQ